MTPPLFLHDLPDAGSRITLTGPEARHAEVLRLAPGAELLVSDGHRRALRGRWVGRGVVDVEEWIPITPPATQVTVIQALPKVDRAELAVDLMTQAGVDRIIPYAADNCVARWDGKESKAHAKWVNAARAAAKQSRRLSVPTIDPLLRSLDDLSIEGDYQLIALHEVASTPLTEIDLGPHIVLLIGPEGGLTEREVAAADHAVVLGPHVLRTATAGTVALGALGVLTDRWDTGA